MATVIVPGPSHTEYVPYDAGGKPEGWDKLSAKQKRWVLDSSIGRREPVWAVMDRSIPGDEQIDQWNAEGRRSDLRLALAFAIAFAVIIVGAYFTFKQDCSWPVSKRHEWKCLGRLD